MLVVERIRRICQARYIDESLPLMLGLKIFDMDLPQKGVQIGATECPHKISDSQKIRIHEVEEEAAHLEKFC